MSPRNVSIDSMNHERSNAGVLRGGEREGNQTCHVEQSETIKYRLRKNMFMNINILIRKIFCPRPQVEFKIFKQCIFLLNIFSEREIFLWFVSFDLSKEMNIEFFIINY